MTGEFYTLAGIILTGTAVPPIILGLQHWTVAIHGMFTGIFRREINVRIWNLIAEWFLIRRNLLQQRLRITDNLTVR
jgi:hypothetical protein